VVSLNAKCGNNHIDGFANGDALFPEGTEVVSTFDRQIVFEKVEDWQTGEELFSGIIVGVLPKALEHFGEDDVADGDRLGGEDLVEPIGLWGGFSVEVVNPHTGIYDNHGLLLDIGSQAVKVAFPSEFAAPCSNGFLIFHLDQQLEREFDDFLLGGESGDFEGINDKDIIDFDVGLHGGWADHE
jgi:hypothetical protein